MVFLDRSIIERNMVSRIKKEVKKKKKKKKKEVSREICRDGSMI